MIRILLALSFILATLTVARVQTAADAIRKADQDWLRVLAAKNLKESVGFGLLNGAV